MIEESWSIDGVAMGSLVSVFKRIDTDLFPPLKGQDVELAFKPGREHQPHIPDSRTLSFGALIHGPDLVTESITDPALARAHAERTLLRLLRPANGAEFALTRTWEDDLGIHTATAMGKVTTEAQVSKRGNWSHRVTFDVLLADPWFYGTEVTVPLSVGVPATVENLGDDVTTAIVLEAAGQLVNPRVTNATPSPVVWVQLGTSVAVGDTVTVDVEDTTALRSSDGANLVGAVTHSGARAWFGLQRGTNDVALSADGGAGTVDLTFRPVWY